ncbi:putative bifunctional diguanylate cyclase/phosphodiesterase [Catenuloplanes indicus]|uniref:Diguanylate cyclase (GGDEF)-like protein n=1 Tax=Catenuloplanes indicus TaxID=137267 RepID=A0AAE4B3A1_9ACTN|nr:bifunctional diguanylate cyclase/phosphodiesterase [Catenuloplanes indicus]MDQ0369873.1 diguanylate cyclase (GGDEF)-like protein [Catenuloplanes indicus]
MAMLRPAGWPLVIVAGAWVSLLAAHLSGLLPDDGLLFRRGMLLGSALAAAACWIAGARALPPVRRAWWWMAAGWTVLAGAILAYAVADLLGVAPSWGPVAIQTCRLLWAPLMLTGVLSFPMRPLSGRERLTFAADITTVVGGGFMIMWYFLIGPMLARGGAGLHALLGVAFPLTDLALLFGVCTLLLRSGITAVRHPLTALIAGLAVCLAADLYWSYDAVHGEIDVDSGWRTVPTLLMITGVFLAAAAAAARIARPVDVRPPADDRLARSATQLPYLALSIGYALLLAATAQERALFPWGGLVAGMIVMTGAVAARQILAMRENHELVISDALTGLANRVRLRASLDTAVRRQVTHGEVAAVLLIDLDGFKRFNDTRGHEAGDAVLIAFADVLRQCVRQSDTAGRLGGDEFAVVLHKVGDAEQAEVVARRILAAAARELTVDGVPSGIGVSIGIALTTADDPADVVRHRADMAMYQAKRRGGHRYERWTEGFEDLAATESVLAGELGGAVGSGQLRVFYQPIVTLATGEPVAVEALVRWHHPERGLIPPDRFIPLAEQTGAIEKIGLFVLEEAARQVVAWQRLPGRAHLRAGVNLSPRQLASPGLVDQVSAILARTGLSPHDLVLELTESAVADDGVCVTRLEELRRLGIRIALDDFGTGYSSLRYLTRLPVDILKLDRCFVSELNGEPEGSAVAEAVIRLSQVLHLDTVAEGIETAAQATELTLLGCRTGQGYHYARPMPAAELEELIHTSPALGGR